MAGYRITRAAQDDIASILAWSHEQFGHEVRRRYESLISTAIRDAASHTDNLGRIPRPELGEGVFSWHLSTSRVRVRGKPVRRPRHFLICRVVDGVMVVGRVLHDAMELRRHLDHQHRWE